MTLLKLITNHRCLHFSVYVMSASTTFDCFWFSVRQPLLSCSQSGCTQMSGTSSLNCTRQAIQNRCLGCICTLLQWETFKGENFHEFCGLGATHDSFLHKNLGMSHPPIQLVQHSTKVFSMKCSFFFYILICESFVKQVSVGVVNSVLTSAAVFHSAGPISRMVAVRPSHKWPIELWSECGCLQYDLSRVPSQLCRGQQY